MELVVKSGTLSEIGVVISPAIYELALALHSSQLIYHHPGIRAT
jgi:hypothetical protein